MTTQRLANKIALITGGSSGIGLATAQRFQAEGAKIYITGRDASALSSAAQALNIPSQQAIQADSSSLADIQKTADTIQAAEGTLDVLFYNAGIAKFAPLADTSEALFDETFNINTKGANFTIQRFAPILADQASVILNGTFLVSKGLPGTSVYSASKAALLSMAKTCSAELIERGIRVNVVTTGPTSTPIYGKTGLPAEAVEGLAAQVIAGSPMQRFGEADEIAKAATFLASSDSSYVLGSEIVVDGGFTQL